ncbi:MAG: UDP-N-acetylmuramoyl-L-alanine--D-glutamate ligase [Proteobacteria bacterium]|nr:UDP-N-acetylmuramoyl-L-alanine--D-glutamate ligase [Pseudomonadota bacterium]
MRLAELEGRRVAIWGVGREGRATLAVLRTRLPAQTFTLFCSEAEASVLSAERAEGKSATPARLESMACEPDAAMLKKFDIVIKSPGISAYKSQIVEAEKAGVRFVSGTAIWFAENPQAKTLCVTGTKGKSTVAALIAHLLRAGGRRVALAGNIGLPLLELLAPEVEPDWWVIELSSFQARDFGGAPTVAIINNVYEEHLDWHVTRENYVADKLRIAARAERIVINAVQSPFVSPVVQSVRLAFNQVAGWHAQADAIWRGTERVLPLAILPLPGEHNALNVCAALAAIEAVGEDAVALAAQVTSFKALPHRLQSLGVRDGVEYINDSIATTPYAAIEALRSVSARQATILVGGFDRGVDWKPFVDFVEQHPPRAIVTMGANGDAIAAALATIEARRFALVSARDVAGALTQARALTDAGGAILLSPGAPSFDQFRDYAERGREFARLAGFDPAAIAQIEGMGIA